MSWSGQTLILGIQVHSRLHVVRRARGSGRGPHKRRLEPTATQMHPARVMRALLDPMAGVLAPRASWASTRILKEAKSAVRVTMADLLSRRRVSCAQIPSVKLVPQTPPPTRGVQGSVTAHARQDSTVTPASVCRALYVRWVPLVRSQRVLEPTACVIKDSMEIQDKASHVGPALPTRRHDRMCRVRASFKTARYVL